MPLSLMLKTHFLLSIYVKLHDLNAVHDLDNTILWNGGKNKYLYTFKTFTFILIK